MKNNCSSFKMSGDELNTTDKELLSFHHWIEESNKDAYKRGLEEAAKIVDYHAGICTDRHDRHWLGDIAAAIRAKIQERDDE